MNDRYVRFEKRVTHREGKKNLREKENFDRNNNNLNSIIDRMLPDSPGADILSPLKDLRFLIQLNIPPYFPSPNLACWD